MGLAGVVEDVLLLSKARSEVVAEQMTRRVPHEVRVTAVRENGDTAFGMSQFHLWNPCHVHGRFEALIPVRELQRIYMTSQARSPESQ